MGIYKTYREAVLAKGSTEGIYTPHKEWTGKDKSWIGQFVTKDTLTVPMVGYGKWVECNPADHLETLKSFLASGKRLGVGDKIVSINGLVISIKQHSKHAFNTPKDSDNERFIIQAAADQVETPEEKEAFDSIPNQTTLNAMSSEAEKESYNSALEAFDAIDTTSQQVESLGKAEWKHGDDVIVNGKHLKFACLDPFDKVLAICYSDDEQDPPMFFHVNSLQKPETPAEREERERLEAAYHLYCKCGIQHDTVSFEKFKGGDDCYPEVWLDIVNETGYRKKEED